MSVPWSALRPLRVLAPRRARCRANRKTGAVLSLGAVRCRRTRPAEPARRQQPGTVWTPLVCSWLSWFSSWFSRAFWYRLAAEQEARRIAFGLLAQTPQRSRQNAQFAEQAFQLGQCLGAEALDAGAGRVDG